MIVVNPREAISYIFNEIGENYEELGLARCEIHQGHDIHAFYHLLKSPSKVIHVQGYPGMSNQEGMRVWARLMDYNKMIDIRETAKVTGKRLSIGNEHEATIQNFGNFGVGIFIPYSSIVLEDKIAENVPELNIRRIK